MQELIKETGLTNKQFAEYYGIPYNTVLQWSKGIRQAPVYLVKLIKENRELKTKGIQLEIKLDKIKLLTIKENAKREIEATKKLIEEIEKEANFWGVEATITMQIDFAHKIKQEIYYKRGIEYILRQIEDLI